LISFSFSAILKRVHAPRQIVSNQNEHLRSKLTGTLTLLSLIFLCLYFPYAIVHPLSYFVILHYKSHCNVRLVIILHILQRLSELLNIGALGINFFLYILGVNHYRSSAVKMLGLHHYQMFSKYLIMEHRNVELLNGNIQRKNSTQKDCSAMKLLKVKASHNSHSTSAT